MKKWFYMIVVLLVSGSCGKTDLTDCFTSTGKITEITRETGPFNRILLKDNVNLHLIQGEKQHLVIKAGANLMKNIVTWTTPDSLLEIANTSSCNWVRSYRVPVDVYLTFEQLNEIEYRSVGTIDNSDTLRLDSLKINVREGAGTIRLTVKTARFFTNIHNGTATVRSSGITGASYVYSAGFGLIDNSDLHAVQVYLRTKSSNDVYIRSSKLIDAVIENIGNVYYYGTPPEISKSGEGAGKLIGLEK